MNDTTNAAQEHLWFLNTERRNGERHKTILRVATVRIGEYETLGLVRDISDGGMMVQLRARVTKGQKLDIILDGNQLTGNVIWHNDALAGLQFDKRNCVHQLLTRRSALSNGEKIRKPRVRVEDRAVIIQDQITQEGTIYDLSQSGAKLAYNGPDLTVTQPLYVDIQGLARKLAHVRWRRRGFLGIEFASTVPLMELMDWLMVSKQTPT